jgi:hypothetical protein
VLKSRLNITLSCWTGDIYTTCGDAVEFFHNLDDDKYRVFFKFNETEVQIERGDTSDRLCRRWMDARAKYVTGK